MEVETPEESKSSLSATKTGKLYTIAIIIVSLFITWLHYSTVQGSHALHDIYREFYYIPVFMGALVYGLKGAALSYLLVVALYTPSISMYWSGNVAAEANKFLHLTLQGLLALSAGLLIDRDKKSKMQLQKEQYLSGIGRAASAIVHDLRNPIVTILGFARRVQEGKGNQDANIQTIIDSATGMEMIVNDVLDFSKPMRLEVKEEDVRHIVKRACDIYQLKAERNGVNISCVLPSGPVRAVIDRHQMERAISNLLSNAIEASSKGQSVSISTDASGNDVSLTVKDQGHGMDKETRENIFTPFYTKKSTGTGLGMPIVKKIVDGHRGTIQIKSNSREGTEVKITFPHNHKAAARR